MFWIKFVIRAVQIITYGSAAVPPTVTSDRVSWLVLPNRFPLLACSPLYLCLIGIMQHFEESFQSIIRYHYLSS